MKFIMNIFTNQINKKTILQLNFELDARERM